jgi:hypothetical protein
METTSNKSFDLDYDKTKAQLSDNSKNISIPQQKPSEQVNDSTYATEVIALPSKGLCYPTGNPLENGKIEMKYMTSKEEDILLSKNLISKGLVFDKLFQSLIVTQINYDDLLGGDKDAIMLAARILGYGPIYTTLIDCPKCGEPQNYEFSLSEFKEKEIDESLLNRNNEYEFTIPSTGKVIKFKFLTHYDEKLIDNEKKQIKDLRSKLKAKVKDEPDADLSLRLKHTIIEVDGKREKQYIAKFLETFRSSDSLELRRHIYKISPGIDLGFQFICNDCDHRTIIDMPIDVSFFWPNARI